MTIKLLAMLNRLAFLFIIVMAVSSCKNDPAANSIFVGNDTLLDLDRSYITNPSAESALNVFNGIIDYIPSISKYDSDVRGFIQYGMDAVKTNNVDLGNVNTSIVKLGKMIFDNPGTNGINQNSSHAYADACDMFAKTFPDANQSPDLLFKAAEVVKSLKDFPRSIAMYDKIINKYPNYEKASTSLFLKGFIIENNMKNDDKALEIYNEFLTKFPDHDLADDVQFLIENLGKTDEEILEMIEAKQK